MWSLGCILAELMLGKPLFPGKSTLDQLARVLEITGYPNKEDIESMQSTLAHTMLESLPSIKHKRLRDIFPTASDEALDLLKKLLKPLKLKENILILLEFDGFINTDL